MTWHWRKTTRRVSGTFYPDEREEEVVWALYDGDREVMNFGCVDGGCHCSGDPPSSEDAARILQALNAAAPQRRRSN